MLDLELHTAPWGPSGPPAVSVEPPRGYRVGDAVRLGFSDPRSGRRERAWVRVTLVAEGGLEGRLFGDLHFISHVTSGARVAFGRQHVLGWLDGDTLP